MPRAYHNLDGLIRDVESAYRSEDADGQQRWTRWVDIVEWALETIEGPGDGDLPEGDDSTPEAEMDSDQLSLRGTDDTRPRGPAPRVRSVSAAASLLDRALDGLAGDEREKAIAELDALRRDSLAVARPVKGQKRNVSRGKVD